MIKDEGFATAQDVARIDQRLANDEQKFTDLDKRMQEMERRMESATQSPSRAPRKSTGRGPSTTSGGAGGREGWVPRLVHVRGFVELGCAVDAKLRKSEVAEVQQQILQLADSDLRSHLECMQGFGLNHKCSFRVTNGWSAAEAADALDALLQRRKVKIRSKEVRAVVEKHPWSRRRYAV